jgi:hypothetical protein
VSHPRTSRSGSIDTPPDSKNALDKRDHHDSTTALLLRTKKRSARRDILNPIAGAPVRESHRHFVDLFSSAREAREFQADELEITE